MSYIQELRFLVGHRPLMLIGVQVLIFDQNMRILLQHRTDDNTWDCPGGFMDLGESTEDTARREIREETGLEIRKLTFYRVFSGKEFFYTCPNGDQVFPICIVYVTNDVYGDIQPDGNESSEVRYFPIIDLPKEMLPQVRLIIDSYINKKSM
jgi:8-oxo-dGTP pyrophosphatase MutT (NUDIX family)